jgi:hypothetical protein
MTYTLQQPVPSAGAFPQAYASSVPAGALLVVPFVVFSDSETITSVTDNVNAGNWDVVALGPANAMGERPYLACRIASATGTPTVSLSKSGGAGHRGTCYAFNGVPAGVTDVLDILAAILEVSGATVAPSGTLANVPANALIIGQLVSTESAVAGAAYTRGASGASNYYEMNEYLLDAGSGGDKVIDWTWAGNPGRWNIAAASFRSTALGASGDLSANESGMTRLRRAAA